MKAAVPAKMPANALVAKNTRSGPSSMMSFGQTSCCAETSASGVAASCSGCGFILALCSCDCPRKVLRIERLEIVNTFTDADGIDGEIEALGDGDENAAP